MIHLLCCLISKTTTRISINLLLGFALKIVVWISFLPLIFHFMRWAGHVVRMEEMKDAYRILDGRLEENTYET
jgi:hypothetical protein